MTVCATVTPFRRAALRSAGGTPEAGVAPQSAAFGKATGPGPGLFPADEGRWTICLPVRDRARGVPAVSLCANTETGLPAREAEETR